MSFGKSLDKRAILFVVCYIFISALNCFAVELKTKSEEVTLTGTIHNSKFNDANDKLETIFLLSLDSPIDVAEDDFGGPAKNVKKVQLVFAANFLFPDLFNYGRNYNMLIEKEFLNKDVKVTGILFYPITAHHHTEVLIEVRKIAHVDE